VEHYGMADQPGPLRFVHLTDTHIMAGGRWRPRGGDFEFDTEASLRRVVAAISALEPPPAFVVVGGDNASPDLLHRDRVLGADDYEPSYRLLREILAPLACPQRFVMGNHDNREAFTRVFGDATRAPGTPRHGSFDVAGHHFVVLDSLEPGQAAGFVDGNQLAWLEQDLAAHRTTPTIAFVHHHPWPVGHTWIDTMPLRNGDDVTARLAAHGNVTLLICGHVHLDHAVHRHGLTMVTTPSTCIQLTKVSNAAKMTPGPPAFRIVDLDNDTLATRVVHLHGTSSADF
jgi:Icc protein